MDVVVATARSLERRSCRRSAAASPCTAHRAPWVRDDWLDSAVRSTPGCADVDRPDPFRPHAPVSGRAPLEHHPGLHARGLRAAPQRRAAAERSEEHTSELQSLMRISYAVFCLTNKNKKH